MLVFDVSHLGLLNSPHQKLRKPCTASFYSLIILQRRLKSAFQRYTCPLNPHLLQVNSGLKDSASLELRLLFIT